MMSVNTVPRMRWTLNSLNSVGFYVNIVMKDIKHSFFFSLSFLQWLLVSKHGFCKPFAIYSNVFAFPVWWTLRMSSCSYRPSLKCCWGAQSTKGNLPLTSPHCFEVQSCGCSVVALFLFCLYLLVFIFVPPTFSVTPCNNYPKGLITSITLYPLCGRIQNVCQTKVAPPSSFFPFPGVAKSKKA